MVDGMLEEVDRQSSKTYPSDLEGYFFHVHGFKMLEKATEPDYSETYRPLEEPSADHMCPNCESEDVEIDLYSANCNECGFSSWEPDFNTEKYDFRLMHEIRKHANMGGDSSSR